MGDFDEIHRCTVGGGAFQLEDFSLSIAALLRDKQRVGSIVKVEGEGWIAADDSSDLATQIMTAATSMQISGQDFEIFGPDEVSWFKLFASQCADGGPHVGFEMLPGLPEPTMTRRFRFTVDAETNTSGSTYTLSKSTRTLPDGLREIEWSGEIFSIPAQTTFDALLSTFRNQYDAPDWVVAHKLDQNNTGDRGRFTMTAMELYEPMPIDTIVDGTFGEVIEVDEQYRMRTVLQGDFILTAGYQEVYDLMRSSVVGPVMREMFEVVRTPHLRMRFQIETMTGGNGNALTEFHQRLEIRRQGETWQPYEYNGTDPVLVQKAKAFTILVQSGSATGVLSWIKAPDPLFPESLIEQASETYTDPGDPVQQITEWSYAMAVDDAGYLGGVNLSAIIRPTSIQVPIN